MSNNTYIRLGYDPDAPVPIHHWQMELATICVANSLTLITFLIRIWYRWTKLKRFRREDRWIVGATMSLVGLFVCQLGASMSGSGLRLQNVIDAWLKPHWIFSWGWIFYYFVLSMTKVAICCCFLDILPDHFKLMRRLIVGLCFIIMALAIAESLIWLLQCKPFLSNFVWDINQTSCIDIDPPRYTWSILSILIDLAILIVPFKVVRRTGLQPHEKNVLNLVFTANLIGTIACAAGIYGVWENRQSVQGNVYYSESTFIMINDIEIFCYSLGATFPIFSRFLISKSTPSKLTSSQTPKPSWLRSIPFRFFASASRPLESQPRRESCESNFPHADRSLLSISQSSTSPFSYFITVPEKLNDPSATELEIMQREIMVHTPLSMVTTNGINSNIAIPSYISKPTSTRTTNSRGDGVTKMGFPSVIDGLEIGYNTCVGSETRSEGIWDKDIQRQPSEHTQNPKTTAL